jgi:hypothetical protein
MAVNLPTKGVFRYGPPLGDSYTWPVETRTEETITPVYDPAGWTVIYNVHTITAKAVIADTQPLSATGTSTTLQTMKRVLMAPGNALYYSGRGLGDTIDIPNTQKDVIWGPKPKSFKARPLGDQYACEVEWVVEFALPLGPCEAPRYDGLMSFTWGVTYSTDHRGRVVRTINGQMQIAMSRLSVDSRSLPDHVDEHTAKILNQFKVPDGPFRRDTAQRTISPDCRTCHFTIVDREIPAALPADCTDATQHFSTQSHGFNMFFNTSTLTASYTLRPGVPKVQAVKLFFDEVKRRLDAQRLAAGKGASRFVQIPTNFRMEEDTYGESAGNFTLSWTWTVVDGGDGQKSPAARAAQILPQSAMWTPRNAPTFTSWQASLKDVFDIQGVGKLHSRANDQVIVDLCSPTTTALKAGYQATVKAGGVSFSFPPLKEPLYVHAISHARIGTQQHVVRQRPLPSSAVTYINGQAFRPQGDLTGGFATGFKLPNINELLGGAWPTARLVPDVFQLRAQPQLTATLLGAAIRIGAPVVPPVITAIGGLGVAMLGDPFFQQAQIADLWGIPVFAGQWLFNFALPNLPGIAPAVPPNPAMQVGLQARGNLP